MQTGSRTACIVEVAENRAALLALGGLIQGVVHDEAEVPRLVFLHGRTGMGKTRLCRKAIDDIQVLAPHVGISELSASDLVASADTPQLLQSARQADFLVVEDLQHLAPTFVEALIEVVDERDAEGRCTLVTAIPGPRDLGHRGIRFPARLRSRLAAGLVIALAPLSVQSRIDVLEQLTRGLNIERESVPWLARQLATWREIEGAVMHLERMANDGPVTLAAVRSRFANTREVTVDRIAERVAGHFDLNHRRLKSAARARKILLARQISMYLARRLTQLSLEQIGHYFGGRDHSTVLHACSKVERVLATPSELTGAIRELEAELA